MHQWFTWEFFFLGFTIANNLLTVNLILCIIFLSHLWTYSAPSLHLWIFSLVFLQVSFLAILTSASSLHPQPLCICPNSSLNLAFLALSSVGLQCQCTHSYPSLSLQKISSTAGPVIFPHSPRVHLQRMLDNLGGTDVYTARLSSTSYLCKCILYDHCGTAMKWWK